MSTLLDDTIDAHGGLARWNEIKEVSVDVLASGALFDRKGYPSTGKPTNVRAHAHSPYVERRPFPKPDQYSVFAPDRVAIMTDDGNLVGERTQPRRSFAGHTSTTPWDVFHVIYFGGYANWEYLTTPFSFKMPGFQAEELPSWEEDGELWRRLKVLFPQDVPTHSTKQTFYFDKNLLLRRQDYNTRVIGGGEAANYAFDYETFDGIKLPMKRRVYPRGADNKPIKDVVGVSLDMSAPHAF